MQRREVPAEQVPIGPGRTSLAADEFVLEVRLPPRPARAGDAYLRLIPRTEMDIAVVGAGVSLSLDAGGVIEQARVSLGAVAPTALLVADAGAAIVGTRLDEAALERLDAAARAAAVPISDKRGTVDYRIKIAGVLARRAAAIAYQRAESRA
jgi:carbon-monoxide dehydrogenase medium subunit